MAIPSLTQGSQESPDGAGSYTNPTRSRGALLEEGAPSPNSGIAADRPRWEIERRIVHPHDLHDGEVGQPAHLQRAECQDDAVLGHPGVEQLLRDAVLRPIALDPELVVDDVNVHQAAMNATNS